MASTPQTSSKVPPFEVHTAQVQLAVRDAFARIVEALPGEVTRAHELSKMLGIDKKLGWRVVKVIQETNPLLAAQHVPGPAGVRIFLDAAARFVPEELIRSAARATKDFEQLVEVHAGDRASLEMMVTGCAKDASQQANLAQRKRAFAANSYLWGVQARAQLKAHFLNRAAEEGRLDMAWLRGLVGLRRMRSNVPWLIGFGRVTNDVGQSRPVAQRVPLDQDEHWPAASGGVPLLREFCSKPLPRVRRYLSGDGFMEDELVEGPVGNTGTITCVVGEASKSVVSYYRSEHNRVGEVSVLVRTPCEVLLLDQFVHEDVFGRINPDLAVYSQLGNMNLYPTAGRTPNQLPVWERVEYLGKGPAVVHTLDVPHYADMVRYVFRKLNWEPDRFDVYRVRIEYPVIPTSVVMRHELPQPPGMPETSPS